MDSSPTTGLSLMLTEESSIRCVFWKSLDLGLYPNELMESSDSRVRLYGSTAVVTRTDNHQREVAIAQHQIGCFDGLKSVGTPEPEKVTEMMIRYRAMAATMMATPRSVTIVAARSIYRCLT